MKHILYLFLILLVFSGTKIHAQKEKDHSTKYKSLKIGYISEQLDLSVEEAEKFWPIYNEYQEKIKKLRRTNSKTLRLKLNQDIDKISDAEAEMILDNFMKTDTKIQTAKNELYTKLKSAISIKKVLKLHKAEHGFKRKMLLKICERRAKKEKK